MNTVAKMKLSLILVILLTDAILIHANMVVYADKIPWSSSAIVKIPDMLELFVTPVSYLLQSIIRSFFTTENGTELNPNLFTYSLQLLIHYPAKHIRMYNPFGKGQALKSMLTVVVLSIHSQLHVNFIVSYLSLGL